MTVKAENMILDLLVQTNPKGIVELESNAGIVRMIPFGGTVSGPLFQGNIEPCGVDTQIINTVGVRHMSARYMLTGTDHTGLRNLFYLIFADAFSQTLGFLRLFISETGAAAKLSFCSGPFRLLLRFFAGLNIYANRNINNYGRLLRQRSHPLINSSC